MQSQRPSRPVAYVAVQDAAVRAEIIASLEQAGWSVVPQPTGFHVLQAIADVIDGTQRSLDPMLIVIDSYSRGCTGATIAAGLRDLGLTIPIVLLHDQGEPPRVGDDEALRIVDAGRAAAVVTELASRRAELARDRPHTDSGRISTGTCL